MSWQAFVERRLNHQVLPKLYSWNIAATLPDVTGPEA